MEDAMAELARGDGTWENIQELERACVDKVDCESFHQQQAQVEAIARSMSVLNEEMRSRDTQMLELKQKLSTQVQQVQQVQASLDTLRSDFQTQLAAMESSFGARATQVEDSCSTLLQRLERRLELLEEELSILVAAIDKKADVESVNSSLLAQKRALEDAIRKRCKKSAFDNEVLAVHNLLRHQQSTIETRLEDALAQAKVCNATQLQHDIRNFAELCEEKLDQMKQKYEARSSELATTQQGLLSRVELKLSTRIEEHIHNSALDTANIAAESKVWLRQAQQEFAQLQQMNLRAEQGTASQRMKDDLEHQLLVWKESISKDWMELQNQMNNGNARLGELQRDQVTLKAVSEALQTELSGAATALRNLEQRLQTQLQAKMQELHVQLSDEIAPALHTLETSKRTREKKLRQQVDALSEKLGELDQIVKLVGKQLIQNTSQLQLFRKEQHARRQINMAEELVQCTQENLLLGASEGLDDTDEELQLDKPAQPSSNHNTSATPIDGGDDDNQHDETMLELRSQHDTLRHAIRDKLRHYQEVLQQE